MKTTYFILVLGLLLGVTCSLPVKEDETPDDEILDGSENCLLLWFT